jgi:hypothetical protein
MKSRFYSTLTTDPAPDPLTPDSRPPTSDP